MVTDQAPAEQADPQPDLVAENAQLKAQLQMALVQRDLLRMILVEALNGKRGG